MSLFGFSPKFRMGIPTDQRFVKDIRGLRIARFKP